MPEISLYCDAETVMEMAGTIIIGLESSPLLQALIPIMVIPNHYGKIVTVGDFIINVLPGDTLTFKYYPGSYTGECTYELYGEAFDGSLNRSSTYSSNGGNQGALVWRTPVSGTYLRLSQSFQVTMSINPLDSVVTEDTLTTYENSASEFADFDSSCAEY
jgi:hypothetical protein